MGRNLHVVFPIPLLTSPLKLIVSHIFSWTRDEVYFNLFSCWLQLAVVFRTHQQLWPFGMRHRLFKQFVEVRLAIPHTD